MWYSLSKFVLRFRVPLFLALLAFTAYMGFRMTKVEMSYDSNNAIPTSSQEYKDYAYFQNTFGADGNQVVVGIKTNDLASNKNFEAYVQLSKDLQSISNVTNVLGLPNAITVGKDSLGKMNAMPLVTPGSTGLEALNNLDNNPFYSGLLYNKTTGAYLMAVGIDKYVLATKGRGKVIDDITLAVEKFKKTTNIETHLSGLPFIRTSIANKVQKELRFFLIASFVLTAVFLLIFFRSLVSVFISLIVVAIGVIWSFGTVALAGYDITILIGIVPPLMVIIGVPNCIYFLNKYHSAYAALGDKRAAIHEMVGKMGVVTLFTNITAGIGFGVFFFTKSVLLRQFGLVAGINIFGLFIISLIVIPVMLSFLAPPKQQHTKYIEEGGRTTRLVVLFTNWVFHKRKAIYAASIVLCVAAGVGLFQLKQVGFIVDDLPPKDPIYQDLKFFEANFKGVMPLEILINTNKKYGALTDLNVWQEIDQFTDSLTANPNIGSGLSLIRGVKFIRQGMMGQGAAGYVVPSSFEFSALRPQLISAFKNQDSTANPQLKQILYQFLDSNAQVMRLSVTVKDIGSQEMPKLLDTVKRQAKEIFGDGAKLTYTGASITFLAGSSYIIHSLRDSLLLALGMILLCMIFLFRSFKVVVIALIANLVPLIITAGFMGWVGVHLRPSTVLVFSIALGITVDVTIRFLVNYKQELPRHDGAVWPTVRSTMAETGVSIIFTSIILAVGFGVFAISEFKGTQALGYLTAMTLLLAMVTNLLLLPALLLSWHKKDGK